MNLFFDIITFPHTGRTSSISFMVNSTFIFINIAIELIEWIFLESISRSSSPNSMLTIKLPSLILINQCLICPKTMFINIYSLADKNFFSASFILGFLSGWYLWANWRYAFFIYYWVAVGFTPRTSESNHCYNMDLV